MTVILPFIFSDFSVPILGSGSDFEPFISKIGVTCADVSFSHDTSLSTYPLYHSVYETFHLQNDIVDPTFEASLLHNSKAFDDLQVRDVQFWDILFYSITTWYS